MEHSQTLKLSDLLDLFVDLCNGDRDKANRLLYGLDEGPVSGTLRGRKFSVKSVGLTGLWFEVTWG